MNNMHHHPMSYASTPGTTPQQPVFQSGIHPQMPYWGPMHGPSGSIPTGMPMGVPAPTPPPSSNILSNPRFIRGVLVGAAAVYLLTNENVQQAAIKTVVKVWSLMQGGVEEMKERFRDADAELHAVQQDSE